MKRYQIYRKREVKRNGRWFDIFPLAVAGFRIRRACTKPAAMSSARFTISILIVMAIFTGLLL